MGRKDATDSVIQHGGPPLSPPSSNTLLISSSLSPSSIPDFTFHQPRLDMANMRVTAPTTAFRVMASVTTMAAQEASFREPPPASDTSPLILRSRHLSIIMLLLASLALLLAYIVPCARRTLQRRSAARRRAESMAKLEKQFRNTQIHASNSIIAVKRFVAEGRIKHARQHFVSNVENTTKKWNRTRERVLKTFSIKFPGEPIPDFLATESTMPEFPEAPRGFPSGANSPPGSSTGKAASQYPLQATPSITTSVSYSAQPIPEPMPLVSEERTTSLNPVRSLDTSSSSIDASLATLSSSTTSATKHADTPREGHNVARVRQRVASATGQVIDRGCTVEVLKINAKGKQTVRPHWPRETNVV